MAQILTKRKRQKIPHNGFLYVFDKPNKDGDKLFWWYEFQASEGINCNGRIHTDSGYQMLKEPGNHTCIESGPAHVQAQMAVSNIKRHALETLEQPATIWAAGLENIPTPVMAQLPTKNATKQVLDNV